MSRKLVDSGVSWIGKIPEGWKVCRFKDAVRLYTGDSIADNQKAEFEDPSDARPYVSSKDINLDYNVIDYNNGMYVKLDDDRFEVAPKNSVLMCIEGGSAGRKKAFVEKDVCFVNKLCCFYSEHESNRYVYHFLCSPNYAECFRQHLTGMIGGVSTTDLKNINLLLPPLAEQQRIAAFLDRECEKINGLRGKIEKQIAKLDELKKSTITEAVTGKIGVGGRCRSRKMKPSGDKDIGSIPDQWNVVKLKYCCYIRARLGWKGLKADEYVEEGYPFLSAFNIVDNKIVFKDLNYINQFRYDESPEIKLSLGDILLVKDGAGVGKCGVVRCLPKESTVNGSIAVVSPSRSLNSIYLYYYFSSSSFENHFRPILGGMGVPHLFQSDLRELVSPLPPLSEQKEIAEYLDKKCAAIDAAKEKCRVQLEKLAEYKKSLIYEYVTGKRSVFADEPLRRDKEVA